MSDLSTNKILGAGLATALIICGLGVGVPIAFMKTPPAKPGDLIAVAADTSEAGAGADVDTPPDWGTVLPTADVAAGEAKTAACKACHVFDPSGANNIGPGLYGVVGRKPGSHPGFSYSAGMTAFGGKQPIWDYQHIYEFLNLPGPEESPGSHQRHRLSAQSRLQPAGAGAQPQGRRRRRARRRRGSGQRRCRARQRRGPRQGGLDSPPPRCGLEDRSGDPTPALAIRPAVWYSRADDDHLSRAANYPPGVTPPVIGPVRAGYSPSRSSS
jgi:cytochrome c